MIFFTATLSSLGNSLYIVPFSKKVIAKPNFFEFLTAVIQAFLLAFTNSLLSLVEEFKDFLVEIDSDILQCISKTEKVNLWQNY